MQLSIIGSPPSGIGDLSRFCWLSNIAILSVPDEGYSRIASCALNLISTFSLLHHMPVFCKFSYPAWHHNV